MASSVAALFFPVATEAQETEVPTTRGVLSRLQSQVERNEASLRALLSLRDLPFPEAADLIRTRVEPTAFRAADFFAVDFTLEPDSTLRIRDGNGISGLVLTGKWIQDYARYIRLVPEYEKLVASYRSEAELHRQLVADLEGALEVKDQKIATLEEIRAAERDRADLYKTLAEVKTENLLERIYRKLAFPIGLTVGIMVGVVIAQ